MDAKEQPKLEYQQLLDDIMEATPDVVEFRGRKRKIGWLHKRTQRKFSHIMKTEGNIEKRNVKLCACILTNNIFIWFKPIVYALRWRWYWYILDLDDVEVLRVLDASKKKIQFYPSLLITTLSTEMTDVMMAMTRKEAKAIQAGQAGEQPSR